MRALRIGEPTRVAFVGRQDHFGRCALAAPAGGLVPRSFDCGAGQRTGELVAAIEAWGADVVVFFAPALIEPQAVADLRARTVAFLTETLPRKGDDEDPRLDARRSELARIDRRSFDRVIAFDPLAEEADPGAVWRSAPLPVDDRLYAPVRPSGDPPRALFLGRSTERRERVLIAGKHAYDLLHYAHGLHGDTLARVFARVDVGINVHAEPYRSFSHRALMHLAAGHLLVSEPLSPTHGLEPGIDFVEVRGTDELMTILHQLQRRPDTFDRIRRRGRDKAEAYRASRVWPRLIGDLLADLAAFGSPRS